MKTLVHWITRFQFPVYWGYCPSRKAWDREMKMMNIKDAPYPKCDGCVSRFRNPRNGNRVILVTFSKSTLRKCTRIQFEGVVLHEAVHVHQFMMQAIDETSEGIEIEAYNIQAIYDQLRHCIDEHTPPRFKKRK